MHNTHYEGVVSCCAYEICVSIIMHGPPRPLAVKRVQASRHPCSSIHINSWRPRPRLIRRPHGLPCVRLARDRASLQHRGRLSRPRRLSMPWPSLATVKADNAVAVSRDREGLQHHVRLSRPHWPTTRRTTHPSAPAYKRCG